ncbi:MAG: alkaline phosphatase family protein [Paludibacteraceae bacterium]
MRHLFFISFLLIFTICLSQEKQPEPPRLVVGIKIDGLQAEHLQKMWKYFTPGGFRKIVSESVVVERMQHNIVSAGNAADVATYMTGTYPFFHGVSSDYFYNLIDNQIVSVLFDKNQTGIGTKEKFSAHNLLSSTFTDELMMSSPLSQVHSIAIDAEDAIMMGGHTATSVSWIDDSTNKWVTTAYYSKGLSRWADIMNVNGSFKNLSTEKWTPSATMSTYLGPTVKGSRTVPFNYDPVDRREGNNAQTLLKNTPAANTLVTELAKTIFEKEQLGTDKNTDVLMLQYTLKIPNQIASSLHFAENEDMYIRLDRDIQSLLHTIISKAGADKTLVFVVGSGSDTHSPIELGKNQIPAGLFNADRALALLNTYLMAIYGQEKWVSGYYSKNIFLNKKKIEDKKLNWNEFQNRVTDFLTEFEGVQAAYTSSNILNLSGISSDIRMKTRNSFNKNTSGDILIELMPGWIEIDNKGRVVGDANSPLVFVPFYLMGKGLKPQQMTENYSTTDISPTISNLIGIPMSNACIGKIIHPLPL